MENVRIGILGLGAISGIYLKNLHRPVQRNRSCGHI